MVADLRAFLLPVFPLPAAITSRGATVGGAGRQILLVRATVPGAFASPYQLRSRPGIFPHQYPDKVDELMSAIEQARLELGDKDIIGSGARFFSDSSKSERILDYEKWSNTLK